MTSTKDNASGKGGAQFSKLAGGERGQNKVFECSANHISKIVTELRQKGLALRSTAADTQLATLPKVLQHFGPHGLNTYEGTAAGYLRIATRIKELKAVWDIHTLREDVIGPDGMFHKGVGRYVLVGKRRDLEAQGKLDLGGQG
jgi:hypothetical protein